MIKLEQKLMKVARLILSFLVVISISLSLGCGSVKTIPNSHNVFKLDKLDNKWCMRVSYKDQQNCFPLDNVKDIKELRVITKGYLIEMFLNLQYCGYETEMGQ